MHRKALGVTAVLLGALAFLPSDVSGQAKNQKNQNKAQIATDQDYYLIQNQKALTGQVLSFDDSTKTVSVRIDFPEWKPNPKYKPNAGAQHNLVHDYNRLMQEQQRVANSKNPSQAQQHYVQMMNLQNRIAADMARAQYGNGQAPFMSVDHLKDFEFTTQDNIVYRKMFLSQEYDDTGNLKVLSEKEKAALKGDNNPKDSYTANAGEVHPGQGVWLYLTPPKTTTATTSKDTAVTSVPRPTVKRLVIFKEGTVAPSTNDNPKKKKN
jgi:hypothetical protein